GGRTVVVALPASPAVRPGRRESIPARLGAGASLRSQVVDVLTASSARPRPWERQPPTQALGFAELPLALVGAELVPHVRLGAGDAPALVQPLPLSLALLPAGDRLGQVVVDGLEVDLLVGHRAKPLERRRRP